MLGNRLVDAMLMPPCHAVEAARVRPVELGELSASRSCGNDCMQPQQVVHRPLGVRPLALQQRGSPMLDLCPGPFYLRDWGKPSRRC
jgi:hypothetical protein